MSSMWVVYCWGLLYRSDALRMLLLCWGPTSHEHLQEYALRWKSIAIPRLHAVDSSDSPGLQLNFNSMQDVCWTRKMEDF